MHPARGCGTTRAAARGRPLLYRPRHAAVPTALALAAFAGCLTPVEPCRSDADCPTGFICEGGICCAVEKHPDAGRRDAGPDAGLDAGEPVYRRLLWRPLRPNVMLVVDKSGSMTEPVERSCTLSNPICCTSGGLPRNTYDPNSPNSCKWKEMLTVLTGSGTGLLPKYELRLRFGLAMFPDGTGCTVGRMLHPPEEANAGPISNTLRTASPVGGTPTAGTLDRLATESALQDPLHASYAMLLTDGSPNCNAANASKCTTCMMDSSQCKGTINPDGTSSFCNPSFSPCHSVFNGAGCLDGDGTVSAVTRLRDKSILTVVVGFGSETATPDANTVLNAAAEAGGLPRAGSPRYYQANTAAELSGVLESVARSVPQCKFEILEPVSRAVLRVLLDGARVVEDAQDGYTYDEARRLVNFVGTTCRILADGLEHDVRFEAP